MSAQVWLQYSTYCPDCGQLSYIFSRVSDGVALSLGWHHELGFVPAADVDRKAARFADRFARDSSLALPLGWRKLDGPPSFAPVAALH